MGLFDPFRRKPASGPEQGDSAPGDSTEDWQAGDIAECVHRGVWFAAGISPRCGPSFGDVHKVIDVTVDTHPVSGQPIQFLTFSNWHPSTYIARAFRKVTPRADRAQAADAEFVRQLRRAPEPV